MRSRVQWSCPSTDVDVDSGLGGIDVLMIPLRLKALAAAGVLAGGLGAAAMSGAFAAPSPDTSAAAVAASPTAVATQAAGSQSRRPGGPGRWGPGIGSLTSVAGFLGISETDLQTDLKNGQTLAQIAQAHGKSTSDLKTFLTNQLKTRLDQAVSSGKMTSQQETTALNNASSRFDKLINSKFQAMGKRGGPGMRGPEFGGPYLSTVAQTLGMQPADVRTELQGGKTLAQIAQEHGKTSTDLENAILASVKTQLDKLMTTNFQQLEQQRQASRQSKPASSTATPTP